MKRWSGWFATLITSIFITCNHQFLSDWWRLLQPSSPKKCGCTILTSLSVFEVEFVASIALYQHCCAALSCIATPLVYCNLCFVGETLFLAQVLVKQYWFWVTILELFHIRHTSAIWSKCKWVPKTKLVPGDDNANLMLICPHSHFQ